MGDTKEFHGKTWYLCDVPRLLHIKWHTHTANTCRTHILMLNKKSDSKSTSNTSDAPPDSNRRQADTYIGSITDTTEYSYVTILPVSTFNIMGNRPEAKDAVAASLMTLSQS